MLNLRRDSIGNQIYEKLKILTLLSEISYDRYMRFKYVIFNN